MLVIYIFLIIIAFLFYILYEGVISFLIFGFSILLPLVIAVINVYVTKKLKVGISSKTKSCTAKQNVPFSIFLTNDSIFPILNAEITLEYTGASLKKPTIIKINSPVYANNIMSLDTDFCPNRCGLITCRINKIRVFDLLRLTSLRLFNGNYSKRDLSVIVMPEDLMLQNEVSDYSDFNTDSDTFSPYKSGDDPSEIFSFHEYAEGDRLSRVHWKLSAKSDELMVKEYSQPICEYCTVLIDTYPFESSENVSGEINDFIYELAYSVSARLAECGTRHKISVYSEKTKQNESFSVFDTQSVSAAFTSVFDCGYAPQPDLSVLSYANSAEENGRCAHLILICAKLSEAGASALISSGSAQRYTVILCANSTDLKASYYDKLNIIAADRSSPAESLAELIL